MQGSEEVPDDVPFADAAEQQREAADEETLEEPTNEVPLEAAPADWQEQRETVDLDPELEEFDRDS